MISGSYPENPLLRQNHCGKTPPGTSYTRVDLAMRESVRIINEELRLQTFACCEYHLCDLARRQYEVFPGKGRESDYTYRPPYRSYIALDLGRYHRVFDLIKYLKGHGFAEDKDAVPNGRFDVLKENEKTDIARIKKTIR